MNTFATIGVCSAREPDDGLEYLMGQCQKSVALLLRAVFMTQHSWRSTSHRCAMVFESPKRQPIKFNAMATKTIKGASMPKSELNPYGVGLLRLKEVGIASSNYSDSEIEYIGKCSINRVIVVLGKVNKTWTIKGRENGVDCFIAHYEIRGKRSVKIYRDPGRDRSKPLWAMTADEIFHAGCGEACPKHQGRGNRHSDIGRYK